MRTSIESCHIPTDNQTRNFLKELREGIMTEEQYCEPLLRITQVLGDKKKGTITHYGQIHAIVDEEGKSCAGPELEQKIIEGQKKIFETLKRDNPDFVFVEGFVGREPELFNELIISIFDDRMYQLIKKSGMEKKLLNQYYAKTREEAKERLFYLFGGGIIYGILNKKITAGAETKLKNDQASEASNKILGFNIFSCSNLYKKLQNEKMGSLLKLPKEIGEIRETEALVQISRVIQANPGKKIALIYGESHDFSAQYFKVFGSHGPTLVRVDFPENLTKILTIPHEEFLLEKGKPIFR